MALDPFRNISNRAHQVIWDLARHLYAITRVIAAWVWIGRGWDPNSSEHGTGRAIDIIVVPASWLNKKRATGKYLVIGDLLAAYLIKHARLLHIRHIIWNGRIWKTRYSQQGWRPLSNRSGISDWHYDHLHIFLEDTAGHIPADDLGGTPAPGLPTVPPATAPTIKPSAPAGAARPFSIGNVLGARAKRAWSGNVATLQVRLNAHYKQHGQGRLTPDGYWGPDMQRVYDAYRRRVLKLRGTDATGAPGAASLAALLVPDYYIV